MQKIIYILTFILLFTCCSKDKEEIFPSYKGKLIGYVKLIEDQQLELPITDYRNVEVKIWAGNKCISTTLTDSIGFFKINNINTGVYNITFGKDSFNTATIYQYSFYGNGTEILNSLNDPQYVVKKTSTKLLYININIDSSSSNHKYEIVAGFKFIKKYINPDPTFHQYNIRLFISRDSSVSCSNYELTVYQCVIRRDTNLNQPFSSYLNELGNFKKGTKIFIKAYIVNNSLNNYNPITGKNEYYGINPDEFITTSLLIN